MEFIKNITVKKLIFESNDSGYVIFEGEVGGDLYTFKGVCSSIDVGATLDGEGTLRNDRYGQHFQMSYMIPHVPTEQREIAKYIQSLKVPGIGDKTANKIAEKYGTKLFELVEEGATDQVSIKGVSQAKIEALFIELTETVRVRSLQMFVVNLDLGMKLASKLVDYYGDEAERLVRENPYRLMFDIDGVGFEKADKVARKLGFAANSDERIKALIYHSLDLYGRNTGSTTLLLQHFMASCLEKLGRLVDPSQLVDVIWQLREKGVIFLYENSGEQYVSLTFDYMNEKGVAKHALRLEDDLTHVRHVDFDAYLQKQKEKGIIIEPTASQLEAIKGILKSNISLLIGGPGMGKTFTVKLVIDALVSSGYIKKDAIGLAAPTGIASKILETATSLEAQTVHRLLKYLPETGSFQYNEYERMEELQLLLVDEYSMLDAYMSNCLLKAVANKTQVVIIGDKCQLPSVEKGAVLRDLISSGKIPTFELLEGRRFSERSEIGICASDINNGVPPSAVNRKEGSFYFKRALAPKDIVSLIIDYISRTQNQFGLELDDIQVLTPRLKGALGSIELSKVIKQHFNPTDVTESVVYNDKVFGVGDRVILKQNMYSKSVYNGDIGKIINIYPKERRVLVEFKDQITDFEGAQLVVLDLAYAISVHKSQGSQFPVVIMPFHSSHGIMLYRSLVYTGVTRTQTAFVGIGDFNSLVHAARTDTSSLRQTSLVGHLLDENYRIDSRDSLPKIG